ncbi:TetR/AcrR family transcriptional regulator [Tetragenococcus koreensis]|uniref:TetR/AcrR family transcriptional regulator n=2 Tax=Tetragenococcus koreensis TaxID=290335 RepID=UPI001F20DC4C|nr:TetR/AcrR family transcriptional regulator [Tetragenococcus koreensis]MCF1622518.1 TetR/AcrR family transcriptional regulator [Tetragenococcus koreensis]MCF1681071.1 TetR/AcrR family transcriptional regulator [Tetragenococcus koreensis]MDN5810379.1 TetR/AcrR family transcriptional regulator [Tetragenococcus koreensis]MDN6138765.1 TetR/AcrR family transcriptional regulator [Tetragenococcus koreensis]MDN6254361.1 TetR/AcrR family transcriptional regulator [Tetragenococcus koreensis]
MARKKTITRDQILEAAYEVVAKEGFSRFTARNIAAKMKCSTQPIYLEFKNMDDLKQALLKEIFDYLAAEVLPKEHSGDKLVDLGFNYIEFATKEKKLYKALYLEENLGDKSIQKVSFDYFVKLVQQDPEYKDLPEDKLSSLYTGFWIIVTGLAALTSANIMKPTDKEINVLLTETIKNLTNNDDKLNQTFSGFKFH